MNIELFYQKEGGSHIPVKLSLNSADHCFYNNEFLVTESNGSFKFYCDFPFNADCFIDITVTDSNVIPDHITITQINLDDFWELKTKCWSGYKIENNIMSEENDYNSIFYIGTLRYYIKRPLMGWIIS
jgi:hypothetical protein